jgi:aryl-alcohol dehydrogenase-like predicted oxidoreductase
MNKLNDSPATGNRNTVSIGDNRSVCRLGFGIRHLLGSTTADQFKQSGEVVALLKKALELGINFIEASDPYDEQLIFEALYPYPQNLVIGVKSGYPHMPPHYSPQNLREAVEKSLERLHLEQLDFYQYYHRDEHLPIEIAMKALAELQKDGKIRHIGLSNVSPDQLAHARKVIPVVAVENHYNLSDRSSDALIGICEQDNLTFVTCCPLGHGDLALKGEELEDIARSKGATRSQVALAWLLKRSDRILAVPNTWSVAHLEENLAALQLQLSEEEFEQLAFNYLD